MISGSRRTILIVDDNAHLKSALSLAFKDHDVFEVGTAVEADGIMRRKPVDLVLLEARLDRHASGGLALLRRWRSEGIGLPVIVLSTVTTGEMATSVFESGADDFVRKPFHGGELRARILRLLQRGSVSIARRTDGLRLESTDFWFGGARVAPDLTILFPTGGKENLYTKQYGMLQVFSRRAGGLVLRDEVLTQVWGPDASRRTQTIKTYLSDLRGHFARHGARLDDWIENVKKVGWRIHPQVSVPGTSSKQK